LKFWRFAAAEVPRDRDELIAWLYARWQELDDWVGEMRTDDPDALSATSTSIPDSVTSTTHLSRNRVASSQ
jgi:hypothetical protein